MALLGAVLFVAWPTLRAMEGRWSDDPQYSHGYLVPIFSAWLLWARWDRARLWPAVPGPWGLLPFGLGLLALGVGQAAFVEALAGWSLVLLALGGAMALGGRRWAAWAAPSAFYLAFMVPLPFRVERDLMGPMQSLATEASAFVLQAIGLVAHVQGNTILMDGVQLDVLEACSGLRMLVALTALFAGVALAWTSRPALDRLLIVGLAVPIALVVNVFRVTTTGLLHAWAGHGAGEFFHEHLALFVMMPLALALLGGALWTWDRLLVAQDDETETQDATGGPEDGRGPAAATAETAEAEVVGLGAPPAPGPGDGPGVPGGPQSPVAEGGGGPPGQGPGGP